MTKAININKRVAELSAILPKIEQPYTDSAECEMYGIAEEVIGYNSRFACYYDCVGWDCGSSYNSVVLQSCEEYQVLRYYQIDAYMSGEGMRKYYENSAIHADDDDWFENEEDVNEYYDELEIQNVTEYKQVWIDKFGNTITLELAPNLVGCTESFLKVESVQSWISLPCVKNIIMENIEEWTDFCHTYNESPNLEFYLSKEVGYLSANEPMFFKCILGSGQPMRSIGYFNTFRIAHKHGFKFPTKIVDAVKYLDILDTLRAEEILKEKQFLNAPYYICPTDINKVWEKMESKKVELIEKKELAQVKLKERDFAEYHSYLFGIEFDSPNFHFKSLDSVKDYYYEGKTMHHCIYKCKFYNNHHFLSMHISDHEGNRVATCTINVQDRTINQIQPIENDTGYYHNYGKHWRETKEYRELRITLMKRMDSFPVYKEKTNTSIQIAV